MKTHNGVIKSVVASASGVMPATQKLTTEENSSSAIKTSGNERDVLRKLFDQTQSDAELPFRNIEIDEGDEADGENGTETVYRFPQQQLQQHQYQPTKHIKPNVLQDIPRLLPITQPYTASAAAHSSEYLDMIDISSTAITGRSSTAESRSQHQQYESNSSELGLQPSSPVQSTLAILAETTNKVVSWLQQRGQETMDSLSLSPNNKQENQFESDELLKHDEFEEMDESFEEGNLSSGAGRGREINDSDFERQLREVGMEVRTVAGDSSSLFRVFGEFSLHVPVCDRAKCSNTV
jgi:hypothetical protein